MIEALENGVSQWPKLEGRFPQIAGCQFAFNPDKPPGQRICPELVKIQGEYVDLNRVCLLNSYCYSTCIVKYRSCSRDYLTGACRFVIIEMT